MRGRRTGEDGRNRRGFSLIKLLIVIAIILIVAAMAMPKLNEARKHANEASAIGSMRTINTAQIQYLSRYGRYAQTLNELGSPAGNGDASSAAAGLIPDSLASGLHSGYVFTMVGTPSGYTVVGDPQSGATGTRRFYTDHTNAIRQSVGQTASETDPEIQ